MMVSVPASAVCETLPPGPAIRSIRAASAPALNADVMNKPPDQPALGSSHDEAIAPPYATRQLRPSNCQRARHVQSPVHPSGAALRQLAHPDDNHPLA